MRSERPLGEAIELARVHVCFELAIPGGSVENGEPAAEVRELGRRQLVHQTPSFRTLVIARGSMKGSYAASICHE